MGVRILTDRSGTFNVSALYCSTTDVAFGPLFCDDDEKDSEDRAESFLKWLPSDARTYSHTELMGLYSAWCAQESDQYTREKLSELEGDEEDLGEADRHELAALRARFA